MNNKPSLSTTTTSRHQTTNPAAVRKNSNNGRANIRQTTIILEAEFLAAAKAVAFTRKRAGVTPCTLSGMVRKVLQDIVDNESQLSIHRYRN